MGKQIVRDIIERAYKEGRKVLTEFESKQILDSYGIPITRQGLAGTADMAVKLADDIGYPVVLKVVSPDIIHKTDAGGVKLNILSPNEVRSAFDQIIKSVKAYMPSANILGISVQEMVKNGVEVMVGMKRDDIFGPAVLFGLGGIFVEILRDITLRVVPITRYDAYEMIREIKGYPLLRGYRGQPPRDVKSIADIILKVAKLAQDFEKIKEMDLNPVVVREKGKGAKVLDSRIILE